MYIYNIDYIYIYSMYTYITHTYIYIYNIQVYNIYIYIIYINVYICVIKAPNISSGLIFVREHFFVGLYMGGGAYMYIRGGAYTVYGQDFVLVYNNY